MDLITPQKDGRIFEQWKMLLKLIIEKHTELIYITNAIVKPIVIFFGKIYRIQIHKNIIVLFFFDPFPKAVITE